MLFFSVQTNNVLTNYLYKKKYYQNSTFPFSVTRIMYTIAVTHKGEMLPGTLESKGLVINYGEGGYKMGKLRV